VSVLQLGSVVDRCRRVTAPRALRASWDFAEATPDPDTAGRIVRWSLELRGRLPKYRLASRSGEKTKKRRTPAAGTLRASRELGKKARNH